MSERTAPELTAAIEQFVRWYSGETDQLPRRPIVARQDQRPKIRHPRPKGRSCSHRNYRLTCEDYDDLLDDFGNSCGICSAAWTDELYGGLCVDHDAPVGQWAVRGLLCNTCNTGLSLKRELSDADKLYLANPWYARVIAARGLSIEPLPEPDIGAVVYEHFARRRWTRTKRGWVTSSGTYQRRSATWRDLNRDFGPHNLEVMSR